MEVSTIAAEEDVTEGAITAAGAGEGEEEWMASVSVAGRVG